MIELKNVGIWQKAIEAISSFISEGNFRFNDKGISFKAIDPSQIVLVDYFIEKSVFNKFDIEPTFVGVDVVELSKIMNRALPNDKLLMDLTDSELVVELDGDLTRSFKLPLIDVSDDDVSVPETKFDARIEINARILKEALKDAALFGSSVILRVKENQFLIEARGSQGTLRSVVKQPKSIKIKSSSEVASKYSLNFLQNIVKEADPETKVILELKNDAPMKISYDIGNSKIQFHLAHMIL